MMRNRAAITAGVVLSAALLGACSLFGEDGLERGEYEGFYTWGWEINDFRPCNSEETWLVTPGNETAFQTLLERFGETVQQRPGGVYVRLDGKPSEKGRYGHMDDSDREFRLYNVLEVRAAQPGDCGHPGEG